MSTRKDKDCPSSSSSALQFPTISDTIHRLSYSSSHSSSASSLSDLSYEHDTLDLIDDIVFVRRSRSQSRSRSPPRSRSPVTKRKKARRQSHSSLSYSSKSSSRSSVLSSHSSHSSSSSLSFSKYNKKKSVLVPPIRMPEHPISDRMGASQVYDAEHGNRMGASQVYDAEHGNRMGASHSDAEDGQQSSVSRTDAEQVLTTHSQEQKSIQHDNNNKNVNTTTTKDKTSKKIIFRGRRSKSTIVGENTPVMPTATRLGIGCSASQMCDTTNRSQIGCTVQDEQQQQLRFTNVTLSGFQHADCCQPNEDITKAYCSKFDTLFYDSTRKRTFYRDLAEHTKIGATTDQLHLLFDEVSSLIGDSTSIQFTIAASSSLLGMYPTKTWAAAYGNTNTLEDYWPDYEQHFKENNVSAFLHQCIDKIPTLQKVNVFFPKEKHSIVLSETFLNSISLGQFVVSCLPNNTTNMTITTTQDNDEQPSSSSSSSSTTTTNLQKQQREKHVMVEEGYLSWMETWVLDLLPLLEQHQQQSKLHKIHTNGVYTLFKTDACKTLVQQDIMRLIVAQIINMQQNIMTVQQQQQDDNEILYGRLNLLTRLWAQWEELGVLDDNVCDTLFAAFIYFVRLSIGYSALFVDIAHDYVRQGGVYERDEERLPFGAYCWEHRQIKPYHGDVDDYLNVLIKDVQKLSWVKIFSIMDDKIGQRGEVLKKCCHRLNMYDLAIMNLDRDAYSLIRPVTVYARDYTFDTCPNDQRYTEFTPILWFVLEDLFAEDLQPWLLQKDRFHPQHSLRFVQNKTIIKEYHYQRVGCISCSCNAHYWASMCKNVSYFHYDRYSRRFVSQTMLYPDVTDDSFVYGLNFGTFLSPLERFMLSFAYDVLDLIHGLFLVKSYDSEHIAHVTIRSRNDQVPRKTPKNQSLFDDDDGSDHRRSPRPDLEFQKHSEIVIWTLLSKNCKLWQTSIGQQINHNNEACSSSNNDASSSSNNDACSSSSSSASMLPTSENNNNPFYFLIVERNENMKYKNMEQKPVHQRRQRISEKWKKSTLQLRFDTLLKTVQNCLQYGSLFVMKTKDAEKLYKYLQEHPNNTTTMTPALLSSILSSSSTTSTTTTTLSKQQPNVSQKVMIDILNDCLLLITTPVLDSADAYLRFQQLLQIMLHLFEPLPPIVFLLEKYQQQIHAFVSANFENPFVTTTLPSMQTSWTTHNFQGHAETLLTTIQTLCIDSTSIVRSVLMSEHGMHLKQIYDDIVLHHRSVWVNCAVSKTWNYQHYGRPTYALSKNKTRITRVGNNNNTVRGGERQEFMSIGAILKPIQEQQEQQEIIYPPSLQQELTYPLFYKSK